MPPSSWPASTASGAKSTRLPPAWPYDENVFAWSTEERGRIAAPPASLKEALEQDYAFLLAGDVFSAGLIDTWVRRKREKDVAAMQARPHPYEVALYFDA